MTKKRKAKPALKSFAELGAAAPSGHIEVDGKPMPYWLPEGKTVDVQGKKVEREKSGRGHSS